MQLDPIKALQARIAQSLKLQFLAWFDRETATLDLDHDQKNDLQEIKEHALILIHECSEAYGTADARLITAGAHSVYAGLKSIQAGVNVAKLMTSLLRAKDSLFEIGKLVKLYIEYQAKKHGVDVSHADFAAAPPAPPSDTTTKKKGK